MYESVYLLQTRESIKNDEGVYKVGRTCQDELKRFNIYPRGSVLHLHASCYNSAAVEKRILERFNKRFRNETFYGKEYFQGDLLQMLVIVCEEIGLSFHCTDSSQDYCRSLLKVKSEAERAAALQEKRYKALEKENEGLNKLVTDLKRQNKALEKENEIERWKKLVTDLKKQIDELGNIHDHEEHCKEDTNSDITRDEEYLTDEVHNQYKHIKSDCVPPPPPPLLEKKHKFQCVKCNKVLASKRQLGYHQAKCNGLHPRQCPTCLKIFSTRQGKYEHIKFVKCNPPTSD